MAETQIAPSAWIDEFGDVTSFKPYFAASPLYSDVDLAMSQASWDVQAERKRQIEAEEWTPEHDDKHTGGELARAAACYATHSTLLGSEVDTIWPWDFAWWKPTDYRRDLVKATALLLAEIERIDRATAKVATGAGKP